MRHILSFLTALVLLSLSHSVQAQEKPVVVELYTSQGCSSCPAADALLHKLVKQDGVIALAMHVDYWDYIGWKDVFASPEMSARQRSYAKVGNRRMVYTPQMIINGQDHVVGNRPKDVQDLIARHSKTSAVMELRAYRTGNRVTIEANPAAGLTGPVSVQLVRFRPKETVKIKRGENAGKTLSYANIVTDISEVRSWDAKGPLEMTAKMTGGQPGVILMQGKGMGAVLAAAWVE